MKAALEATRGAAVKVAEETAAVKGVLLAAVPAEQQPPWLQPSALVRLQDVGGALCWRALSHTN